MDESLCERCGRCCIIKVAENGFYSLTWKDCVYLIRHKDKNTSCLFYSERNNLKCGESNVCVPIQDAIKYGDLPTDCPYALAVDGYKTKVTDWMKEET